MKPHLKMVTWRRRRPAADPIAARIRAALEIGMLAVGLARRLLELVALLF